MIIQSTMRSERNNISLRLADDLDKALPVVEAVKEEIGAGVWPLDRK